MSKKMTKGAVAVAAGVVLLLGGAGTYAVEPSDTAQVVDADVSITFAESTPEREGANAQLDLGNLEFTLEQLAGS
jgi:formate-dependent phosphoribosylglycinamide formyltransferase (GAR transformylase)